MNTYTVYGATVQTDCSFGSRLLPALGMPDLQIVCRPNRRLQQDFDKLPLLYESEPHGELQRTIRLYDRGDREILRLFDIADYVVGDHLIECYLHDPGLEYLVEIHVLGIVLAYWLERRGVLVLHASGVVLGDAAVGFMASNKGGKTTLAAALLRAGHPLITDDLLALEVRDDGVWAQPGFPQMRMWPEDATYFLGGFEDLELAHPGFTKRRVPVEEVHREAFRRIAAPMRALYIPRRSDDPSESVVIEPVRSSLGMQELLRTSFIGKLAGAGGRSGRRLQLLAEILTSIPVMRLTYPDGSDRLESVVSAIERDMTSGV